MKYLMQCGHVANAFDADGKPICAICAPDEKGMTIAREFDGETYSATIESEDGDYVVIALSDGRKLRVHKEK